MKGVAGAAVALALAAAPAQTPAKGSAIVGKAGAFEVRVGECASRPEGACRVSVAHKGKSQKLEGAVPAGPFARGEGRAGFGTVDVVWRTVEIARGVTGVVVTQADGATTTRHDVVLALKGKLVHAFAAPEPSGVRSTVDSADLDGDGFGELVLVRTQPGGEAKADAWSAQVFAWNAPQQRIVEQPRSPAILGAVVGMYGSLTDARALLQAKGTCLHGFVVVDAQSAALLPPGTFAVAALAPTKAGAETALEEAKACDAALVGAVKMLAPGVAAE